MQVTNMYELRHDVSIQRQVIGLINAELLSSETQACVLGKDKLALGTIWSNTYFLQGITFGNICKMSICSGIHVLSPNLIIVYSWGILVMVLTLKIPSWLQAAQMETLESRSHIAGIVRRCTSELLIP